MGMLAPCWTTQRQYMRPNRTRFNHPHAARDGRLSKGARQNRGSKDGAKLAKLLGRAQGHLSAICTTLAGATKLHGGCSAWAALARPWDRASRRRRRPIAELKRRPRTPIKTLRLPSPATRYSTL